MAKKKIAGIIHSIEALARGKRPKNSDRTTLSVYWLKTDRILIIIVLTIGSCSAKLGIPFRDLSIKISAIITIVIG